MLYQENSLLRDGLSNSSRGGLPQNQPPLSEKLSTMLSDKGPICPVYELSEEQIGVIRTKAMSIGNFAALCMREMFTVEERTAPNTCISGKRGTFKLDYTGERIQKIYQYVLKTFSIKENELQTTIKKCNMSMDHANRDLRRDLGYGKAIQLDINLTGSY